MVRVYLSGQVRLEGPGGAVEPSEFPGRQGREAFAFLVIGRGAAIPRAQVADALWTGRTPASRDRALNAIISKLRTQLSRAGLDAGKVLTSTDGCYRLSLPADTWIDHDTAFAGIHRAEAALREGDFRGAYGPSAVALLICQRPFLPGVEAEWAESRRVALRRALLRALECRAEIYIRNGEWALAVEAARRAITLEPFQESAYRHLMRAHAAAGNRAEALRAYDECRRLIVEELGVPPSPETCAVHAEIFRDP